MTTPTREMPQRVVDTVLRATGGAVTVGEVPGELPAVEGTVERRGLSWRLQVVSYPGDVLVARSFLREAVPEDRRDAAAIFANRVNWALLAGNVEVDGGDGTVRVRTSLCPQGALVSVPLTEGLLGPNLGTAALVFPGIEAVAAGKDPVAAADDVLDEIEGEGIDLELD
ncbi:MAG TPA: hypothetical protein VND62_08695 [Acidimicrobiales bacterium]|nr:hypothetical protein [Acidimicrobiales bacterium]